MHTMNLCQYAGDARVCFCTNETGSSSALRTTHIVTHLFSYERDELERRVEAHQANAVQPREGKDLAVVVEVVPASSS
jgi:hypothetical protein